MDVPVALSDVLKKMTIGIFFVFILAFLWATLTEIHEGAVATGEVIPYGKTKTIQHLEGGIVRQILVRDGDNVAEQQTLLVLDNHEAKAQLTLAHTEWNARKALVDRLLAERDGKSYQGALSNDAAMMSQARIFDIRRQSLRMEIGALNKRISALKEEQQAWASRRTALSDLTLNANEERKLNQQLYEQNFISRPRLLALDNQLSDRLAAKGETEAELARVSQRISDSELQISKIKSDWLSAVLEELRKAQDELSVAAERLQVAEGRLQRTRIESPHEGVVKGLRFTTLGAVIPPGGVVLDIVPVSEKMVVEAKVLPDDIDVVKIGTKARVRFTAYKARSHISYDGAVLEISPSTFHDDRTGMLYYLARIEIPEKNQGGLGDLTLQPGMLAEVSFTGRARSPIRYLLDPIIQSTNKAFREE